MKKPRKERSDKGKKRGPRGKRGPPPAVTAGDDSPESGEPAVAS